MRTFLIPRFYFIHICAHLLLCVQTTPRSPRPTQPSTLVIHYRMCGVSMHTFVGPVASSRTAHWHGISHDISHKCIAATVDYFFLLAYVPSKEVCDHFALTVYQTTVVCTYPSFLPHILRSSIIPDTFVSHSSHYRPLTSTFHLLLIFASIFFPSFYSIDDTIHSNEKQYKRKKSTQKVDVW